MPCVVDTIWQDKQEADLFAAHHRLVEEILEKLIKGKITKKEAAQRYKKVKLKTAAAKKKIWRS